MLVMHIHAVHIHVFIHLCDHCDVCVMGIQYACVCYALVCVCVMCLFCPQNIELQVQMEKLKKEVADKDRLLMQAK